MEIIGTLVVISVALYICYVTYQLIADVNIEQ